MDLYEYQGKQLFKQFGIPVSEGRLAATPEEARAAAEELGGPVVVKAQVLTGGRGKAGGVKLADDPDDAEAKARDIIGLDIRGPCRRARLGRARLRHREGVLPLGHVRPRRETAAASCSRRRAASRSRRSPRTIPMRSCGCTSTRSKGSSRGSRAGSSTGPASRIRASRSRSPTSSGSSTAASSRATRCLPRSTR